MLSKINKMIIIMLACFLMFSFLWIGTVNVGVNALENNKIKASILMECESGKILSENNAKEKLPIASVTKLMTILLVLEKIDGGELDAEKEIVATKTASSMGGSQVFLEEGGNYKIKDLLKACIISSANDASVLLAEEIAGSEKAFCELMNEKAEELGLCNTHYENATGLPAPMHYSSAEDVACVMREVLKHSLYLSLSSIWMEDFVHPKGRITTMANTNKLLKSYKLCDGGKTGSTAEAGFCLCATAKNDNMRLISVVLGADSSKTRFDESQKLLEYGFNSFESKKLVDKTVVLGTDIKVQKSKQNKVSLLAEKDYIVVLKKGEKSNYEAKINLPDKIYAPLKMGDVVGEIEILCDGKNIDKIKVLAGCDVDEISYFQIVQNITKRWSN